MASSAGSSGRTVCGVPGGVPRGALAVSPQPLFYRSWRRGLVTVLSHRGVGCCDVSRKPDEQSDSILELEPLFRSGELIILNKIDCIHNQITGVWSMKFRVIDGIETGDIPYKN